MCQHLITFLSYNIIYNSGGHAYGYHQQGIHFRTVVDLIIDGKYIPR